MLTLKVKVLSAYKEYTDNGFPEDPDVYTIRANSQTIIKLKTSKVEYITKLPEHIKDTELDRFLSFRLEENSLLDDGDVLFGPELIFMKLEV